MPQPELTGGPGRPPVAVILALVTLAWLALPASAADVPAGAACQEAVFEATLDGYDQAEITVSMDTEKPLPLEVTLEYLTADSCEPDGDLCRTKQCAAVPEGCAKDDPKQVGAPMLIVASLPGSSTCPATKPAPGEKVTFCIEATKTGRTAVIRFDRRTLLDSAGLLGLSYKSTSTEGLAACPQTAFGPARPYIKLFDKHRVVFDVGTLFSLNGDGSWETNAEAAAAFRSRWYPQVLTDVTFRYSAIAAVDEKATGESDGEDEPEPDPKDFNPLAEGAGVFEANVGVVLSAPKWPRLGLALGGGFSSLEGTAGSALETRRRYYGGIRTEVEGLNSGRSGDSLAGATSWVVVGVAWDDLFDKVTLEAATDTTPAVFSDESERYFLEGEVELPRVGTDWLRILVRSYASIPRSGDGPSDVRVAALASIDPRKWFGGVGKPKPAG